MRKTPAIRIDLGTPVMMFSSMENFDDATVQYDMKYWPFKVINSGSKPKIQVDFKGETKTFWPEEISAMPVTNAVITVPAYFNDSQRQANFHNHCDRATLNPGLSMLLRWHIDLTIFRKFFVDFLYIKDHGRAGIIQVSEEVLCKERAVDPRIDHQTFVYGYDQIA
uniref:Uncharacterized protein n=1 Tax=Tetranychus urticae TaxID=32264 RepID=T1KGQ9_TETUR